MEAVGWVSVKEQRWVAGLPGLLQVKVLGAQQLHQKALYALLAIVAALAALQQCRYLRPTHKHTAA